MSSILGDNDDTLPDPDAPPARILVAEDDDDMRDLVVAMLKREGYDILEASSGVEALHMLEMLQVEDPPGRPVDLLLTDVRMAGMTGLQVGAAIRTSHWPIAVILMTAFPEPAVEDEALRIRAEVLAKPFTLSSMRRVVGSTLAAHARERRPEA